MNILLTSAGRRSYLVNYFKEVIGTTGKVHASNSEWSTALEVADKAVISPLIYNGNYIDFLVGYCKENNITIIISLFDIDLPVLAQNKQRFKDEGINVVVSDYEVTQICNDKWKTYEFLVENGILAPKSFIDLSEAQMAIKMGDLNYPLILKPRWGMGSMSIFKVENDEELAVLYRKVQREVQESYLKYESQLNPERAVIIQEFINGQEYGLDIINDLNKNYVTTFIKQKTAMRSGETDGATTIENKMLEQVGKKIAENLRHIANLDTDCFLIDEKIYILEMNCRFGGGYPFSHLAGANLPSAILKWLEQKDGKASLKDYRVGVEGMKMINLTEVVS